MRVICSIGLSLNGRNAMITAARCYGIREMSPPSQHSMLTAYTRLELGSGKKN